MDRLRLQNIVGLSVGEALPEGNGISNGTFGVDQQGGHKKPVIKRELWGPL